MYYTIYQVKNSINSKIYIGKHQTKDLDDGYMGSGKHLKNAIKKYGLENFEKTILFVFDTEEEMNDKEREIVTEDFCKRKDTYNICEGGRGGFGYINNTKIAKFTGRQHTNETKEMISSKMIGNKNGLGNIPWNKNKKTGHFSKNQSIKTEATKRKISETLRGRYRNTDKYENMILYYNTHDISVIKLCKMFNCNRGSYLKYLKYKKCE
jgi:hypothetical protein